MGKLWGGWLSNDWYPALQCFYIWTSEAAKCIFQVQGIIVSNTIFWHYFQRLCFCDHHECEFYYIIITLLLQFVHWRSGDNQSVGPSVPVVSRWLWPENRTFFEVASMVVAWWIVGFLCAVNWYITGKCVTMFSLTVINVMLHYLVGDCKKYGFKVHK